jgi:DNA-binding IclR family transcriptional regulator
MFESVDIINFKCYFLKYRYTNSIHIYEFRGEIMAVKSAERTIQIIELLSLHSDGLTSKQISQELGIAPSSTFELLKTLARNDYAILDENKKYSIGPKLINVGLRASGVLNLNKLAEPLLREAMNILGETVFMAKLLGDEVVYLSKMNSPRTISTNAEIGSKKPVYCTGLGKAFLAFMPKEDSDKIIQNLDILPYTKNTVSNQNDLIEQINLFREMGYAIDNEEIEEGLWCAAAPVFDVNNNIIAAISVSGPKDRMKEKKSKVVDTILTTTKNLSFQLGAK